MARPNDGSGGGGREDAADYGHPPVVVVDQQQHHGGLPPSLRGNAGSQYVPDGSRPIKTEKLGASPSLSTSDKSVWEEIASGRSV